MKKLIIFSALVLVCFFSACKKNYTCTCTTNIREGNWPPFQTATSEQIKPTSKKKAKLICENTAKQIEANTSLIFADNDTDVSTRCVIQE
jgi:hypothetical protein